MTDTITKQEPKLSVRKPGVWRNKWEIPAGSAGIDSKTGEIVRGPTTHISAEQFLTAEMAEQRAINYARRHFTPKKYLGPVFFPEGDDA